MANVEMYPTCMAKPDNYEASALVAQSSGSKQACTTKDPMLNIRARAASLYMRNGQRNAIDCAKQERRVGRAQSRGADWSHENFTRTSE